MRILTLAVLLAGLAAGVVSMVGGIDQRERGGTRVKYLNLPTLAAAATVFGVVGYPLSAYTALGVPAVVSIAGSAAAAAAAAMLAIIAGWAVPSAAKEVKDERYALQGQFARVTQAIAEGGGGEIEYVLDATPHRVRARSMSGSGIEAGAEVVIERIEAATAFVERWSKIAQQLQLPS
jgi:membrane protein implicated in regulation of membrane protease activity